VRGLFVVFALLTAGCPHPDDATGLATTMPPNQLLNYNQFVCNVQPILIKRCSYLACHGQADHALRIYSIGKLRITNDGTRMTRSAPLTQQEVTLNFQSATGFIYPVQAPDRQGTNVDISQVLLLEKPLRFAFGGGQHHGVGIFPAFPAETLEADPEWQALLTWVGQTPQPFVVNSDCQALFDSMGLTPQ
jgi:hypothetical protein